MEEEEKAGPPNKDLYALLHISPEASDEEIRKAYRQWAQIYHPDKYQAPHVFLSILLLLIDSPLFGFQFCSFTGFWLSLS